MERRPTPADSRPMSPRRRSGSVQGGAPWWAYRRPAPAEPRPPRASQDRARQASGSDRTEKAEPSGPASTEPAPYVPSGQPACIVGASLVAAAIISARVLGNDGLGAWLLPAAGIAFALSFGQRCKRVHPDEPWLPQLLLLGVVAKLVASYVRCVHAHGCLRRRRRCHPLRPRGTPLGRAVDGWCKGTRSTGPPADQLPEVDHRRHLLLVRPEPRRRFPALRPAGRDRLVLLVPSAGRRGAVCQQEAVLHLHDVRSEHRVLAVLARQGSLDATRCRRRRRGRPRSRCRPTSCGPCR